MLMLKGSHMFTRQKGYECASLGGVLDDNPYEELSFNWREWRQGFLEYTEDRRNLEQDFYEEWDESSES